MLRRIVLIPFLALIAVITASLATVSLATVSLAAQAPAGWRVHVDRSQNAQDPDDTPNLSVMQMGNGFHVTGGPAGTFWHPSNTASGNYTLKANFTLVKPSGHTNFYGLVFGGADLDGPSQTYIYFMVAQNGNYIIRQRVGEEVNDVQASTMHSAVRTPDASGRAVNALEVRVAGNTISYVVNGTVVHTSPKSGPTARTDGLTGVRINHQLDVQVDGFAVQRMP